MAIPETTTNNASADEKAPEVDSTHFEFSSTSGLSQDDAEFVRDYQKADHDKVFRKVDWRLMPMLMSLYLIANIDRSVSIFLSLHMDQCILKVSYLVPT